MGLKELENKSIYIIREAYAEFENLAILWSMGKDSTTALALCKKAFFGKIPFPVIFEPSSVKREIEEIKEIKEKIDSETGEVMDGGILCGSLNQIIKDNHHQDANKSKSNCTSFYYSYCSRYMHRACNSKAFSHRVIADLLQLHF